MSLEGRRSSAVPATHVSKRLCLTVALFVGAVCVSGGYVLGNVALKEAKRHTDIITLNLTMTSETLYKKAKRISPKAVNYHDPDKISLKLLDIFHCDCNVCGKMKNNKVFEFVKTLVNYEVTKLIKTINNATHYIDSLR